MKETKGLFGQDVNDLKPKTGQCNGYASTPGKGPTNETCGTCKNYVHFKQSKSWYKCNLMRQSWTGGRGTDILFRSPACQYWEQDEDITD